MLYISVTRFGEIAPLRQNYKCLWQFLWVHLAIGKKLNALLCYLANFMELKVEILEKLSLLSGHTTW